VFSPIYVISPALLDGLLRFEKARSVLEIVPVPTDWEQRVKLETLSRRASALQRFYGNRMPIDEIARIVADDPGRDEKAVEVANRLALVSREVDLQMVLNWINANKYKDQLGYLSLRFKQGGFGERDLRQINTLLMERIQNPAHLGVYRLKDEGEPVSLGKFAPPLAVEVSYQIEDFFRWFEAASEKEINPVIKAGICVWELSRIQPFVEANVLSAVMFASMYLTGEGIDMRGVWSFEEELLRHKEIYWLRLSEVNQTTLDLTSWLEYFIGCMAESAMAAKNKLMILVGDKPMFRSENGRAIALSERQIAIMEDLTLRTQTTIREVKSILPDVSEDTILRDLKDLMDKKLVKKKGHTKGAKYVLGKVKYFK